MSDLPDAKQFGRARQGVCSELSDQPFNGRLPEVSAAFGRQPQLAALPAPLLSQARPWPDRA